MENENGMFWVVVPDEVSTQGDNRFIWAISTAGSIAEGREPVKTKIPFVPELATRETRAAITAPIPFDPELYEKAEKIWQLLKYNISYSEPLKLDIAVEVVTARRWVSPTMLAGQRPAPETDEGTDDAERASPSLGADDPPNLLPAVGYVRLARDWVRAVAVDRDEQTKMLHVVTLEPHELDDVSGTAFIARINFHIDENSHLLVPQQLFNAPVVGITVEEARQTGYEGLNEQESLSSSGISDIDYGELLSVDKNLCWIIESSSRNACSGKLVSGVIAVTSLDRHLSGQPSIETHSAPLGYIMRQLYDDYGTDSEDLHEKFYVPALRKMQQELHEHPIPLTGGEKELLRQLRTMLAPFGTDNHRKSLDVVAAVRWCVPFIMSEESDGLYPLSPEDCDPDIDVCPPSPVTHHRPFPDFPFLGYAQLWGGEAFSAAVDRDAATGMLRVVTLDDYECSADHDIYYMFPFTLMLVPDRFFKVIMGPSEEVFQGKDTLAAD